MNLLDLSTFLGAELRGEPEVEVTAVASLEEADERTLTFVESRRKLDEALTSRAGAFIVPDGLELPGRNVLVSADPRFDFSRAIRLLIPAEKISEGTSGQAVISADATVAPDVRIGPFVTVEQGALVGKGSQLYPGVYVGRGSRIGEDCVLYPNVVVMSGCTLGNRVVVHAGAVIGSDGFGYVTKGDVHHKIPQVGQVIVEDDVEIGANATIDRAALGTTLIGRGTKLDNLVQVAHNVQIGEGCLMAAHVGIAGSSRIGRYVMFGGQVGVADHISVGDGVMVGGQSGLARDVAPKSIVSGSPAFPHREWVKASMVFQKLPEMERRLRRLEKALGQGEDEGKP